VWRRYGDVAFAAVFAVAVSLEAIPLAVLTWNLAARLFGDHGPARVGSVLVAAVGSTAAALLMLTTYVLAYQHVSDRRARLVAERRRAWVATWLRVLDGDEREPLGPLDRAAIDALIALRETLRGERSTRIAGLLQRSGAIERLTRHVARGRTAARLDAVAALSSARLHPALPTLIAAVRDPNPAVSVAAARAAARTLARVEDVVERDRGAMGLIAAAAAGGLPYGVLEEVVVLAEDSAGSVIDALLHDEHRRPVALRAALDGIGRLKLLVFAEEVVPHLSHGDDEVRAAAFRAVSRLGFLPESSRGIVVAAVDDPVDFIRIHATAAARLLPRPQALALLSGALGDRSWWVRRAAADALVGLGPGGLAQLGEAARTHPDRYARDMAAQALRDHVPTLVQAVVG
jgi:HEAT repeat protein